MTMLTAAMTSLRALGQPLADRDAVLQAAALCLRDGQGGDGQGGDGQGGDGKGGDGQGGDGNGPEVLLVTSLGTGRWVLPKGWPMKGRTLAGAALCEAWEEAGVTGTVDEAPVAAYTYDKIRKDSLPLRCRVSVFRVKVDALADTWPEAAHRRRIWMPVGEAAEEVAEPELKALLSSLKRA